MPKAEISVVIIAKNEENKIAACIAAAQLLSSDIWVVDSDSTDQTPAICIAAGAQYLNHEWKGYAQQKNYGNQFAKNDWILSLDADEIISAELVNEISKLDLSNPKQVFAMNRLNHVGGKAIYHGNWNPDWQNRLFNKKEHHWNTALEVHETLLLKIDTEIIQLNERLLHFTVTDFAAYREKLIKYAKIFREKNSKQNSWTKNIKWICSPLFGFIKEYVFKRGFLDGKAGLKLAQLHYFYTQEKYRSL